LSARSPELAAGRPPFRQNRHLAPPRPLPPLQTCRRLPSSSACDARKGSRWRGCREGHASPEGAAAAWDASAACERRTPGAARPACCARAAAQTGDATGSATRARPGACAPPSALLRASHACRTQSWAPRAVAAAAADLPAPLKKIVTAFQMVPDPMQRYKQLLYFAAKLKALPAEHHTPENKVQGCVSQARAPLLPLAIWRALARLPGRVQHPRADDLARAGVGAADAAGGQGLFPGGLRLAADQGAANAWRRLRCGLRERVRHRRASLLCLSRASAAARRTRCCA